MVIYNLSYNSLINECGYVNTLAISLHLFKLTTFPRLSRIENCLYLEPDSAECLSVSAVTTVEHFYTLI